MEEPSVYSPLDPSTTEIRLLIIHPAQDPSFPLICTLQHARLSETPQFEALSYTWGSPIPPCPILLNNKSFSIQENAHAALRRLRLPSKNRTVWIDAICINQSDQAEKEGQLVLMRQIYEQAEQVCVWLGEPCPGTSVAVEHLTSRFGGVVATTLGRSVDNYYMAELVAPSSPLRNPGSGYAWQWANQLDVEVNQGDLRELLSRPWWSRVWIVQEVVVAKKVVVMVGGDVFGWECIARSLDRIRTAGVVLSSGEGANEVFGVVVNPEVYAAQDDTFRMIERLRFLWKHGKTNVSIYQLLYEFRHLQCTDARDRVFGCLGLATADGQNLGIRPDYTSSTAEVFVNAAVSVMKETKSLSLFHYVREWRGVEVPTAPRQAFSPPDQAKYHDVGAMVSDGPETKPRRGWARLPDGWERVPIGEETTLSWGASIKSLVWRGKSTVRYLDHNTGSLHETSPLEGKEPPLARHAARQRDLPPGWVKTWDNLGRASVRYAPDEASTQKPSDQNNIALPSWVPNWCCPTHIDPTPLIGYPSHAERYWASGDSEATIQHDPSSHTMGVDGVVFDKIIRLAEPWHPDPARPVLTRRGVRALEGWETLALDTSLFSTPCPYSHLEEGRKTALWRTYIADCGGELADPGTGTTFLECWYDRSEKGWAKLPPSLDEMTSLGLWAATGVSVDLSYLHWDLHNEIRRVEKDESAETAGSEKLYGMYLERIRNACGHRALFVTERGYIGLAPWNAKVGDEVCVLKGAKTPFLLREKEGGKHRLVGEAYVLGIMEGEAMQGDDVGERMRTFWLV
ncbi:heterokaryon incompatibility protein-domain-containing protein [Echria macrotheca]|uniref:Heterokaryon incompatibility protein-domain-containing protein n=1 Tax=Echria macrotheca TaxID=438768 RepID=A0AAJ0B6Q2_9PEZI|nr:heterokaryon incompatibility protein-domain-containing protein [Echria macrotheca]